ncbi:MAG TPA: hypothetical protein VE978_04610 [Chitinophagales bacterium]|nr:hypothetical protein [Chitinophagales bacterium]
MNYSLASEAETEFAFEGEDIDLDELFGESSFTQSDDPDELFSESYYAGSNDDEIFGSAEGTVDDLDDNNTLSRITREINRDVREMNESETEAYMQDRMGEFWPALISAIPSIVSMAPTAINAVKSIFGKGSSGSTNPAPGIPQSAPPPQAANPPQITPPPQPPPLTATAVPVPQPTVSPRPVTPSPVSNNATATGGTAPQLLSTLLALIQQPDILQMLTNMISGSGQTVTGNNGQQVNGNNVLGVISSLAGTLAGNAGAVNRESTFPEYAVSSEGTFVIDPHESIEEAELILDLLK